MARYNDAVKLHIDLSELRGYSYHTGVVFSVYSASHGGNELARGGRYDDIGQAFGRKRPATGYSTDLRELLRLIQHDPDAALQGGIFVNESLAEAAWQKIDQLREQGERVVTRFPGSRLTAHDAGCDRQLVRRDEKWLVESI